MPQSLNDQKINGHAGPSQRDRLLGQQLLSGIRSIQHRITPRPRGRDLQLVDSATFFATSFQLSWLVRNVLVDRQPMVVGGPKKSLKTSLIVELAISLASGTPFLGHFCVDRPRCVGLYSGESGQAVIQESARRIARSKRLSRVEALSIHWGFSLPRLSYPEDLTILHEEIVARRLEVVILDPLYLALLAGDTDRQASNLFDVGPLLAEVTECCLSAGATPILVHHSRKHTGTGKGSSPELDDLAYAGIQEFARQWLLIGRREAYVPDSGQHQLWLTTGGSAGHSGCWAVDIDEGRLAADFTGRRWDVTVRSAGEERRRTTTRSERVRCEQQEQRRASDLEAMRQALRRYPDGETLTVLRESSRLNSRAQAVLDELIELGDVERAEIQKPAGRSGTRRQAGYRLVTEERQAADDEVTARGEEEDGND
jgi:hypothetical protein